MSGDPPRVYPPELIALTQKLSDASSGLACGLVTYAAALVIAVAVKTNRADAEAIVRMVSEVVRDEAARDDGVPLLMNPAPDCLHCRLMRTVSEWTQSQPDGEIDADFATDALANVIVDVVVQSTEISLRAQHLEEVIEKAREILCDQNMAEHGEQPGSDDPDDDGRRH